MTTCISNLQTTVKCTMCHKGIVNDETVKKLRVKSAEYSSQGAAASGRVNFNSPPSSEDKMVIRKAEINRLSERFYNQPYLFTETYFCNDSCA
ncbi:hypothetical protein TKK_0010336 [Trichogramma kaykai]